VQHYYFEEEEAKRFSHGPASATWKKEAIAIVIVMMETSAGCHTTTVSPVVHDIPFP
jgi:hypothetical protein